MNANEHYREAERLITGARAEPAEKYTMDDRMMLLAAAQVHATLAVAATHGADEPGLIDDLRRAVAASTDVQDAPRLPDTVPTGVEIARSVLAVNPDIDWPTFAGHLLHKHDLRLSEVRALWRMQTGRWDDDLPAPKEYPSA